jgi:uncharacterized OB-fold protein
MKCPTCGTENDAANRFCDQCGSRIEPSGAVPQAQSAQVALAAQPTAAATTCPNCGAVVLPGEAFCDECGTSLSGVVPIVGAASYDAPTVYAPPAPSGAPAVAAGDQGLLCPACGHQNLPGDRFCDNCGAALAAPAPAAGESAGAPPAAAAPQAEPPALSRAASADMPTAEQPGLSPDLAYDSEKQRLEGEIARQQQIITQFEQMQAMFGAAAPPAVTQGLSDARAAQAKAQAELAALTGGAPAPVASPAAPSEPAPAAPPATPSEPTVAASPMPAPEPAVVPPPVPAPEPAVAPPIVSTPPPVVAPVQPSAAPRLVIDEGGTELPLPAGKAEIIIGREDPISGIFPEIDLTPFGGETGGVSRQHARINRANSQWTITDLNSTNYTRVDGNKLDPSLPMPIKDGSRIQFGRIAATFRE